MIASVRIFEVLAPQSRGGGLAVAVGLVLNLSTAAGSAQSRPWQQQLGPAPNTAPASASSGRAGSTTTAAPAKGAPSDPAATRPYPTAPDGTSAEGRQYAAAAVLKAAGDTAFRARNYVDALKAYREAYALYPDPRVLYNAGRSLQALGRFGEALQTMRRFAAEAPDLQSQIPGLDGLFRELERRVCEITIRTNLGGAQIVLGSEVVGTTPLSAPILVNAGQSRLQVVKEGYFAFDREVTLEGNGKAIFEVTLVSKGQNAKLLITSRVAGTELHVDGKLIGQAPSEVVLPAGAHTVLARRAGYEDSSSQVVLEVGQHRTLGIDPQAPRSALYQRWWFWASVGVLSAAVVTSAVVASQGKDGSSGDFSPNVTSAPLVRF